MAKEKLMGAPADRKSEAKQKHELKLLKAWVQKILPDDHDKFDVKAKYDPTLTLKENKTEMRAELKILITDLKSQVEVAKAQQERIEHEQIQHAEREVEEYNASITYDGVTDMDQFYKPIITGVQKMVQNFSNLLFVRSRGGVGKSYQIRKALVTGKADFVEISGDVTEAYLYRLIYDNNGKIIWFKDVVKLLQGLGSINLLKSATETEDNKVLTKSNYSKEQDDMPDKFLCRCKFIFDYNNVLIAGLGADFEALTSRGDYRELPFSDDDIKQMMRIIAKGKDKWKSEVTEEVIKNFESNGMVRLNLRTQWKAFNTYKYAQKNKLDWKEVLAEDLKNMSRIRAMLYSLIGTKAIKTPDLKRMLLRRELVTTLRTADRKINEWLYLEELYKWSEQDKNFFVCINPRPVKK